MRHKIGLNRGGVLRARNTGTGPAPGIDIVAAPARADVAMSFGSIDVEAEPLPVEVVIPPYDQSTSNVLLGLTVLAIPDGAEKPTTAEGFLASEFPKATLAEAPAVPAPAAPVVPVPVPVVAPVIPVIVPAVAIPIPVPATAPAYLPGPAGGTATFLIPGLPDARYEIQVIETYDQ